MSFSNYPMYTGYGQPYQDRLAQLQNQYQQAMTPPPVNQGLLWVQGEAGAKSYLVAPNTTVLLMDSEAQRFFIKTTDPAGMPNLRTFEYSEVSGIKTTVEPNGMEDKFVTREEYEELKEQYETIITKLNVFLTPVTTEKPTRKTKEVKDDE